MGWYAVILSTFEMSRSILSRIGVVFALRWYYDTMNVKKYDLRCQYL